MALHKDTTGNIHDDMDGTALHLLPAGCVKITQAEADTLRAPTPTQLRDARITEIKAQLSSLDMKRIRPLAEGDTAHLATINEQISALRVELATL